MTYTLHHMMSGNWLEGQTLSLNNFNKKFIDQFVDCVVELHSQEYEKTNIKKMQSVVDNLEHVDSFVINAIKEYNNIKDNLHYDTQLHGDIWAGNIIVDKKGNFVGLIDWDNKQVGDIHWDLKNIRRWIGWDGLKLLIDKYNSKTNKNIKEEYIVVLDKISMCHSRQLNKFRKSVFTEYIKRYPDGF